METPPTPPSRLAQSLHLCGSLFPCATTRKVVLLVSMKANYFPYLPCTPEWTRASLCVRAWMQRLHASGWMAQKRWKSETSKTFISIKGTISQIHCVPSPPPVAPITSLSARPHRDANPLPQEHAALAAAATDRFRGFSPGTT